MPTQTLAARLGEPQTAGPLILFPLFPDLAVPAPPERTGESSARSYRTLPRTRGTSAPSVRITEKGGGTVPVLELHNPGDQPVLVLAGEIVEGNLQNRAVNVSLLAPARSHIDIPVSPVEQGRWRAAHSREREAPSPPDAAATPRAHVPPRVRRTQAAGVAKSVRRGAGKRSVQGAVWDAVSAAQATSATRDLTDAWAARPPDADSGSADDTISMASRLRPVAGQVGVVAVCDDRALALDIFDSPDTLAEFWEGLVAGYALDAVNGTPDLGRSRAEHDPRVWRRRTDDRAVSTAAVEEFLRQVRAAEQIRTEGVGLGSELHLDTPEVVGSGLVWQGALVHLAAHPAAG